MTDPYYIWNSKIEHSYKTEIYSRELFTPKYRSPLFLFSKSKTENLKKENNTMAKEYYLYVKGKAVPVSEEVYKAYWKITEHRGNIQG